MKNKGGRPRLTTELLVERGIWKEDWKNKIIELGAQGKSRTHIMEELNLAKSSFYKLYERDAEFRGAVNRAMILSQNWWINITQKSWIEGKSNTINSNHFSLLMRNLFKEDWSEKKEIDISTLGEKITDEKNIIIEIVKPEKNDESSET